MLIEPTLTSSLLAGQVAVVTGGSRGIGGATSTLLAANGAKIVVADVDRDKAAAAVAEINDAHGPDCATAYVADLVQPGACDELVDHTLAHYGGLDIVVNNAGYAWDGRVHSMSDDQFQAMLDIHLVVPFRLARACAPVFRAAARDDAAKGDVRHRKMVMVSSMAGLIGLDGAANYASAKAGVLGLMRSLAREWGSMHVNVNAVAFGIIQTRFGQPQSDREVIHTGGRTIQVGMPAKQAQRLGVTVDPENPPTEAEIYAAKPLPFVSLGRTGTIGEAADAIFWLCSPLSNYVTGQVVPVNGGSRAV
ncbi:3-oxoacyl-[acyl-carrier-protein] reductase FabG [Nocardia cerradoensis]|uniref:3-oxoacyl-[acyl-carrier-protein] reductase FabG n=1 Tax=Nocardia cerradoensis TaxID=85688 RepID=A0A231GUE7_9NOCA|nr:SDR family NAD(P)-dependent oxidoreductase [Nocardia cerradoensis]OXR40165.1 3-oxoacyl-[acyl-carrier-protein] reductase FabG [Nocardia cerradoensis]